MHTVFYHGNCPDGLAAVMAAYFWLEEVVAIDTSTDARFMAVNHGEPLPAKDYAGDTILVLDFAFDEPATRALASVAQSVTVIDHHISSFDLMSKLAKEGLIAYTFDKHRSGAGLAWDTLLGERPALIDYLEDNDIWTKKYPESEAITRAAFNRPQTLEAWGELFNGAIHLDDLRRDGDVLMRAVHADAQTLADNALVVDTLWGVEGPVAIVNCPHRLVDHTAEKLYKDTAFALCFEINAQTGLMHISLRSDNTRETATDVAKLANTLGGGGHRSAAGCRLPLTGEHAQSLLSQLSR